MCYNRHHRQVLSGCVSLNWAPSCFSIHGSYQLAHFSLMSDSNLLSRIDSVRARLVPLRDGL